MKIKILIAQIVTAIVALLAAQSVLGGFEFSRAQTYVLMFLTLFVVTDWLANRIRVFFLLPSMLPVPILLHSSIIGFLFYLSNNFISGITVTSLNPYLLLTLNKLFSVREIGEFGTIAVVSLFCGTVYQLINWLYADK